MYIHLLLRRVKKTAQFMTVLDKLDKGLLKNNLESNKTTVNGLRLTDKSVQYVRVVLMKSFLCMDYEWTL